MVCKCIIQSLLVFVLLWEYYVMYKVASSYHELCIILYCQKRMGTTYYVDSSTFLPTNHACFCEHVVAKSGIYVHNIIILVLYYTNMQC